MKRPFVGEKTRSLGDLLAMVMVINCLLSGMILQVFGLTMPSSGFATVKAPHRLLDVLHQ